jgi:hypothetical protein
MDVGMHSFGMLNVLITRTASGGPVRDVVR